MQDLVSAGYSETELAAIPQSPFMPYLSAIAACFGTAYVIEKAQLGTKVLRKTLGPAAAMDASLVSRLWSGYDLLLAHLHCLRQAPFE